MKCLKYSTEDINIIKDIIKNYIFQIPNIRHITFPIILVSFISRVLEVKVSTLIQKLAESLNINEKPKIIQACYTYLAIYCISSFLIEIQGFIFCNAVQQTYRESTKYYFHQFLKLNHKEFKNKNIGDIYQTIDRQSSAISEILDVLVLNLLPTLIIIILCSFQVFAIMGPISTLIILTSLFLYSYITIKMAEWRNTIRVEYNKSINEVTSFGIDRLNNYDSIVCFNNELLESENFDFVLKKRQEKGVYLWRTFYLLNFLQRLIFGLQTFLIVLFGYRESLNSKFVLYLAISRILASNLDKLGYMYSRFTASLINIKSGPLFSKPKMSHSVNIINSIAFKNVSLYSTNDILISANINLNIRVGEKIALLGRNGCGKSHLLKSLVGFTIYKGSIKLNGQELSDIRLDSLRKKISYAPQESSLINHTVMYNMLYSMGGARYAAIEMARKLGWHDDFLNLPNGYETICGEGGSKISGGQKQKISIIRCLLKSGIHVLDEPTSNLDKESELNLFNYIKQSEDTFIVIVHNLKVLNAFDRVIFMDCDGIRDVDKSDVESLFK
ncbi:ABC transporter B family member 5 [Cucumispora dikerogammari]|nr:ABC transporter B family member 5 [Cucumispora dikerogammari]